MALAHQSIATINSPQFINLSSLDINPLMSSCEIKVFYLGQNRNGSSISKQVASEMAKTLRGAPIVGYYKEEKEDFSDHGHQVVIDDEGIHFNCLTKPYGFVAPDAKVWFQDFDDFDDFGNSVTRTYLMTTGYLWTGQFQEVKQVFKDNGKPQSMQIDDKTIKGKWSKDYNSGLEFFIINDAIFSKLCILGDDVEPCFEGAGVTVTQPSMNFALDKEFKNTLFTMMQQLTEVLQGGKEVTETKENVTSSVETEFTIQQDKTVESSSSENNINQNFPEASFEKKDDEEKDKQDQQETEEEDTSADDKEEDEEDKKKYALLESEYNKLKSDYSALQQEVNELREFKMDVENKQKDDLIKEFYMLSDEDKKDVIENKANYSLEDIKSKLAVICFEKRVNFNLKEDSEIEDTKNNEKEVVTTFNMNISTDLSTPDWVKEVENTMNNI